jgi:hypothetical protein
MSTSTRARDGLQGDRGEQVVLILVGLIGSGKVGIFNSWTHRPVSSNEILIVRQSTFAQALEKHLPGQFRRCNQDDLGNRIRVENLARRTLREGLSACIDRTNFNARLV